MVFANSIQGDRGSPSLIAKGTSLFFAVLAATAALLGTVMAVIFTSSSGYSVGSLIGVCIYWAAILGLPFLGAAKQQSGSTLDWTIRLRYASLTSLLAECLFLPIALALLLAAIV